MPITFSSKVDSDETSVVDARQWLGFTSSTADKGTQLNKALKSAAGRRLLLPPWKIKVSEPGIIDDYTTLEGHSGASKIEVGSGSECAALKSARYNGGSTTGGTVRVSLIGVDFLGNRAGNPSFAEGIVALDGIRPTVQGCIFEDGAIPFSTIMSRASSEGTNEFEDGIFENIGIRKALVRGISATGPHDSHFSNLLIRCNEGVGIYSHGTAFVWDNSCHVYGSPSIGIDSGGGHIYEDIIVEGTTGPKMILRGDSNKIFGGWLFAAGGSDSKIGIEFGDGETTTFGTQIFGLRVEDCTTSTFKFNTSAANSSINARISGTGGEAITGSPHAELEWDVKKSGTIKWGSAVAEGASMGKNLGALGLVGDLNMEATGRIRLKERAAAPEAEANAAKIYAIDNGAGKTQLVVRFGSGAVQQIAIEP